MRFSFGSRGDARCGWAAVKGYYRLIDQPDDSQDVDAVFEKDREFVRKAVAKVALEMDLPLDWLNDAVKGYVSPNEAGNMRIPPTTIYFSNH